MQPGRLGRARQTPQCRVNRHRIEAAPARALVVRHARQYIEAMLSTRLPVAWRGFEPRSWPSLARPVMTGAQPGSAPSAPCAWR
jgi:hypothetical protein